MMSREQGNRQAARVGERRVVSPAVCDPQSDDALEALVHQAKQSLGWTERNAWYLVDKLYQIEEAGTWGRLLEGEPKTWGRFCREVLDYPEEYILAIRNALDELEYWWSLTAERIGARESS